MLLRRVLTALAGIPIVLAAIWFGPPWITILAGAAAAIGVMEAFRMHGAATQDAAAAVPTLPTPLGATWAVALILAAELAGSAQDFAKAAVAICVAGAFAGMLWMIAAWRGKRALTAAFWMLAPPVYIGGAVACAVATRGITVDVSPTGPTWTISTSTLESGVAPGVWWLLLGVLTVYAADSAAYFVGRSVGRHRLAPAISPNKTWEGVVGGLAGAIIAAVLLGRLTPLDLGVWQGAATGVILGVVSPLGDLAESKAKRWAGLKDSGVLFPGHGGMLDRLDSLLPSFIVIYAAAVYFTAR